MILQAEKKAFTLVELLVVIAIIAILMAILMPSLQMAKDRAREVLSMANMRGLCISWTMYSTENEEKLVGGTVDTNAGASETYRYQWVRDVREFSVKQEHDAIRAGALFPYVENVEVYHSPGDRTAKTLEIIGTNQSPYRSYAISDPMNGEWLTNYQYKKITAIRKPGDRLVFVEETEFGGNWGSWILGTPASYSWIDPIAGWYSRNSTILGFADISVHKKIWENETTLEMIRNQRSSLTAVPFGERQDISYMRRSFHHDYRP